MLATQFHDFEIGQRRINQFYPLLGNSIFSSDGAFWQHSRALFRPQFIRENINDLEETEKGSRTLIEALGPVDSKGWTSVRQLQPLLFNFTLDTASSFLFGESINSQSLMMRESSESDSPVSQDQAKQKQFMADFELANVYMFKRIRFQSLYWINDSLDLRRAIRRMRQYIEQFVQKAIASAASTTLKQENKKYNLLSALAEQTQDHEELRNQLLAILVAGRDTTAGLLGWSFARLAIHPDIFHKLRTHILSDFPPSSSSSTITFEKVKACRYLQHFLHEVLRLHPNVPFNNRQAAVDTTLPTGGGPDGTAPIVVAKGTTIAFSVYLMHRRPDLWGEDVLEFRPERWEEERRGSKWQFLPFSGGPRVCLGQQFALVEASYVIIRILQTFDAIVPGDVMEMSRLRKGLGLTLWPRDGVPVKFHRAD
ncbi:cytochrome P450 [Sphaerulina musiva SO2202]|uniref:Cytochrome P450 n=1 Tax=Sphaerulina musiva (strain SO2202) TaxID=692275 RepID=N1QLI3_SPHMS|nr:cytochrome P450 [Sphaerulina musiva SO2202]EMF16518.1 cytochrome P450 [Sphaerulina musiva SO2202]